MGISRGGVKLMMREGKRERYFGRVLTAGRQGVFATADNLEQWAREMDYVFPSSWKKRFHDKEETNKKRENITDEALFLALGFDELESMDYSNYEGCTIVHDLNKDIPIQYHDRYDLSPRHDKDLWNIYSYQPGCLDRLSFGGLNKGMYGIFFVATKTKESSFDADVQQGTYRRIWSNHGNQSGSKNKTFLRKIADLLPSRVKEIVRPYYQLLLAKVPLKYHLKLIARY